MDWKRVERLEHVLPFIKTLQIFGGEPLVYNRLDELCKLAGDSACELELITNQFSARQKPPDTASGQQRPADQDQHGSSHPRDL